MLAVYELLTVLQDIGQTLNYRTTALSRNTLNSYLLPNGTSYLTNLTLD